jgi:LmbE family N-acetylglucosaminyl deacetylase
MSSFADRTRLPPEIGTLLISPHPDDIAYSLGGALLVNFFEMPIVIVTAFSTSMTALYYDGRRDVSSITKVREAEDNEFAHRVDATLLRLGLEDATLSMSTKHNSYPLISFASFLAGFPSTKTMWFRSSRKFTNKIPVSLKTEFLQRLSRFDRLYSIIKMQLSSILSEHKVKTLISPLAVGNHPNHVVISQVCKDLRKKVRRSYFYEDLPYADVWRPSQIRRHVKQFDKHLKPVMINIELVLNKKVDNLQVYRTQVKSETEHVLKYAKRKDLGRGAHERIWATPNAESE